MKVPHSSFDRWHGSLSMKFQNLAMKFQISTSQDVMIHVPRPEGITNVAECHIGRLCRPLHNFLCRDHSKNRFGLRTHFFVQGPVKKSASGCRKFVLLGPPKVFPFGNRQVCRPPHQPFCAGTSPKKRFGVQKVFPLGATRNPLPPETPSTACSETGGLFAGQLWRRAPHVDAEEFPSWVSLFKY